VIGAVYLDGGWDAAHEFVMRLLGERIAEAAAGPGGQDFKTRLQELAALSFDELPRYEVTDEGPDHAKRFFATVMVAGQVRGRGEGRSKKQAEQAAARLAWQELSAAAQVAAAVLSPATDPVVDPNGPSESPRTIDATAAAGAAMSPPEPPAIDGPAAP